VNVVSLEGQIWRSEAQRPACAAPRIRHRDQLVSRPSRSARSRSGLSGSPRRGSIGGCHGSTGGKRSAIGPDSGWRLRRGSASFEVRHLLLEEFRDVTDWRSTRSRRGARVAHRSQVWVQSRLLRSTRNHQRCLDGYRPQWRKTRCSRSGESIPGVAGVGRVREHTLSAMNAFGVEVCVALQTCRGVPSGSSVDGRMLQLRDFPDVGVAWQWQPDRANGLRTLQSGDTGTGNRRVAFARAA
jgi:hypothetical protein